MPSTFLIDPTTDCRRSTEPLHGHPTLRETSHLREKTNGIEPSYFDWLESLLHRVLKNRSES
ncbi:MAG: hypothetical protein R3C59_23590 [Planctomycetaceae bacterium]